MWRSEQWDRANWHQLRAAITETFSAYPRDHWTEIFTAVDACVTPVLSFDEAARHPHLVARGTLLDLNGIV